MDKKQKKHATNIDNKSIKLYNIEKIEYNIVNKDGTC